MMANMASSSSARGKGDAFFAAKLINLGEVRQLSAKALRMMGEQIEDRDLQPKHRIAAGRCILVYAQWREEFEREQDPAWQLYQVMVKALGSDEAMRFLKTPEAPDLLRKLLPSMKTAAEAGDVSDDELRQAIEAMQKAGESK